MDLVSISNSELLLRMEKLARSERKITHLILLHLVEVESRRLYLDLGYTSLFKYLTGHLHYSEDAAYRRIQAARLLKKVPSVEKALESGEINLTQLNQVQKCLSKTANQDPNQLFVKAESVIAMLENKSSYETQRILATEFDLPIQDVEVVKPQKNDSVRMEITFTEDQMKSLNHAKELFSHVLPNPTWSELISYLANAQIQKKLGTRIHKSNSELENSTKNLKVLPASAESDDITKNQEKDVATSAVSSNKFTERKYLSVFVRRRLLENSNHQCEFTHKDGVRCASKYQLQFDHKLPLALGGSNEESNFRVLCRTHNLAEARRMKISKF
ncbi:HNH endonuclease [Bdellovibrio sp. HCB274]|uniref:HNH endonuclease n=1 Tax=Bdellovibrio sp. HCB274 TaxID=3394361 RepID=UPI0039B4950B